MHELKRELMNELSKRLGSDYISIVEQVFNKIIIHFDVKRTTNDKKENEITKFYYMEEFFKYKLSSGMAKTTYFKYRQQFIEFIKYIDKCPTEATKDDIIDFLDYIEMERHLSKHSKSSRRVILGSFYSWLHDNGYISINPVKLVAPVKYRETVREGLNRKEMEKCRIACGDDIRKNTIFEIFYSTGCRLSEILGIRIEDINWDDCRVKVLGKRDKERFVFFSDRAAEYLKKYIGERIHGPLFLSKKSKKAIGKQTIENEFKCISGKAKIGKVIYPHLMRHTFAVTMIEKGVTIDNLSEFMGHSSINTTLIYAKTSINKMKSEHERVIA